MSKETENPFAFPLTDGKSFATDGMLLRDYFAAKAMQALITAWKPVTPLSGAEEYVSFESYKIADAMLQERNETQLLPSELKEQRDELLKRLQSLVLSMAAHPDCTEGSEFDDLSTIGQELINKIENK